MDVERFLKVHVWSSCGRRVGPPEELYDLNRASDVDSRVLCAHRGA